MGRPSGRSGDIVVEITAMPAIYPSFTRQAAAQWLWRVEQVTHGDEGGAGGRTKSNHGGAISHYSYNTHLVVPPINLF